MKVCFLEGTQKFSLYPRFPEKNIYLVENVVDLVTSYTTGKCQVAAVLKGDFGRVLLKFVGHLGDFELGTTNTNQDSEGISLLTIDGDPEWSSLINSVILAMLAAEQANISNETAELFGQTDLFGKDYENMFINVIEAVGSYGQMYGREVEPFFPRTGVNQLNNGSTGLIQAHKVLLPYAEGPPPIVNGTLSEILDQEQFRCAIRPNRPGFAVWDSESSKWSGFDVDYCRALAAVMFGGDVNSVEFVEVENQADGYALLANNSVHVMAGATWNVVHAVKEPTTGVGYFYSQPYFYAPPNSLSDEPLFFDVSNATYETIRYDSGFFVCVCV